MNGGRRLHHAPLPDRLDDEGNVLVRLGVRGDDPRDAPRFRPQPGVLGQQPPALARADRVLQKVHDGTGLGHLPAVRKEEHRNPPLRIERGDDGGAEPLGLGIALGHREDGNAAVIRLEARADELDRRGRNAAAAEVEGHPHRGAARRVMKEAHPSALHCRLRHHVTSRIRSGSRTLPSSVPVHRRHPSREQRSASARTPRVVLVMAPAPLSRNPRRGPRPRMRPVPRRPAGPR